MVMEAETQLELLKGLRYITLEISVLEQSIMKQKADMQGYSSTKIDDMPKGQALPAGLDKPMAAKDALERAQRESIALLYERKRMAEEILRKEQNPDMRLLMRLHYVEGKPMAEVCRYMFMGKATACRINKKIREKYAKRKLIPSDTA